jgi:enediyne polyketide synthase
VPSASYRVPGGSREWAKLSSKTGGAGGLCGCDASMMSDPIAIVGMACRYPDAADPAQLWENVLAGRRAFRRIPDEHMRRADCWPPDPPAPDRCCSPKAAVIAGLDFDCAELALDTAARALTDAGFPGGEGLPKGRTSVVIGTTRTGEFTTIAGRIVNQFDLNGGEFTVDRACSSSLLAVAQACATLRSGRADAALAGGVDLGIDPVEVIGLAQSGALATGAMRRPERNSNGLWPGEGGGVLVLVRQEDAEALRLRSYAKIVGWGIAADGRGGMNTPESHGHRLALERAYQVAGFDISTVGYLEGQGTGTPVGAETQLRALGQARRDAFESAPPAVIGTIEANIGHTKAAAGAAGLIKTALAVHHQVIPPATGHFEAHPELAGPQAALRVARTAELWPADQPVRAGISGTGLGGTCAHLVLESSGGPRRGQLDASSVRLVSSRQDCELLLLDADTGNLLRHRIATLAGKAERISYAEMADVAARAERDLAGRAVRAAVVASSPERLVAGCGALLRALAADHGGRLSNSGHSDPGTVIDVGAGVFLGSGTTQPRIGYLFPGQDSGHRAEDGAIAERFDVARELYQTLGARIDGDLTVTSAAQPRIVAASAAGLRVLAMLGIEAVTAAGHGLGELTSLHWAGGMDETDLIGLAAARGRAMASAGVRDGAVHSPAVARAATEFAGPLSRQRFYRLKRQVVSTVTGERLPAGTEVADLLTRQFLEPVRFGEAVEQLAAGVDLLLEVGPGRALSALAAELAPNVPVVALDTDGQSLAGTLSAAAAAYVLGARVRHDRLFCGRLTRPMPRNKPEWRL